MQARKHLVVYSLCGLIAQVVRAAPEHPDIGTELQLIESTERDLDPLGIDSNVGTGLDEAAARLKPASKPPPPLRVGTTLSAIEPIFEREYSVQARWDAGLMYISTRVVLASKSAIPGAIAYRLPLPEDAVPVRTAVCSGDVCSVARREDGAAEGASPTRETPALRAEVIHDLHGRALAITASPVRAGSDLRLEISYVAAAAVHGGTAQFVLPARGEDPRLVAPSLRLSAPAFMDFGEPASSPDGAAISFDDRAQPWTLRGDVLPNAPRAQTVAALPCGKAHCARRYEVSAFRAGPVRDTWLWLDASPSMEGPARNRADRVLAALLAVLPENTPLHALAFAARTHDLGQFRVDTIPLRTVSDALLEELGNSSRVHALVQSALPSIGREAPRILVLSDGKLDPSDHGMAALATASAHGAEVWLLNVGSQPVQTPAQLHTIALGSADTMSDARLADALRGITAVRSQGRIAGEEFVAEQGPPAVEAAPDGAPALWQWLARHAEPPVHIARGAASEATRDALIPAPAYTNTAAPAPSALTGMPKESVLSMLRDQLVPRARACLRADRRGRADYAVGLTFEAEFAAREVYDTHIRGEVPRALASCLLAILPDLRVPAFTGRVRVRYPIHTERELVPAAEELPAQVSESVARALRSPVRTAASPL